MVKSQRAPEGEVALDWVEEIHNGNSRDDGQYAQGAHIERDRISIGRGKHDDGREPT